MHTSRQRDRLFSCGRRVLARRIRATTSFFPIRESVGPDAGTSDAEMIFCAYTTKPTPYIRVKLFFEDFTETTGVWTGDRWECEQSEVHPVSWQPTTLCDEDSESGAGSPRSSAAGR